MFERLKANILFKKLLERPDINKAYAMVNETDSWYNTIKTVHESLDKIKRLPHEVIEIASHDNLKLKAIYYPNNSNITVICVHGYTSHAEREWAFPGLFYLSLGFNVLIPYQRAHGLSEGDFITLGALEYKDMINWIKKINEFAPDSKILIHGLSMGGGIALDLINKELKNVKGIIADAPSMSIDSFFINVCKNVFKENGEKVAKLAIKRFNKMFNTDVAKFDRMKNVENSKYPLLLSAGSNEEYDDLFTYLKSISPCEVDIIILKDCNHGNGMYKKTKAYQSAIKKFIKRNFK